MKPLDFVRPKDQKDFKCVGIVIETNSERGSVAWLGKEHKGLKTAWWSKDELDIIDNLPRVLSNNLAHPFGCNTSQGDNYFPIN